MKDMTSLFWSNSRPAFLRPALLFITFFLMYSSNSQSLSHNSTPPLPDLRHQIAQMLMIGVRGTGPELTGEMLWLASDLRVGGFILYEYDAISRSRPRNIISVSQLTQLVSNLKEASSTPLLISIDQEGGRVNRLKTNYGFPPTVSAQYLGDLNNPDTTAFYARRMATTISSTGINLNFAPVTDVNINPDCPVIGKLERSFSANPDIVAAMAEIFYDKQREAGILTTYKHFPGHGSSTIDSHAGFTDVTNSWQPSELAPYARLIKAGKCDLIMTAHVFNSHLDPDYPATLSTKILKHILRDSLGFEGVIVSDDMMMGAITQNWPLDIALERAIAAGVDILILSNNVSEYNPRIAAQAVDLIEKMVHDGRISAGRIAESYDRIAKLHRRLNE